MFRQKVLPKSHTTNRADTCAPPPRRQPAARRPPPRPKLPTAAYTEPRRTPAGILWRLLDTSSVCAGQQRGSGVSLFSSFYYHQQMEPKTQQAADRNARRMYSTFVGRFRETEEGERESEAERNRDRRTGRQIDKPTVGGKEGEGGPERQRKSCKHRQCVGVTEPPPCYVATACR